MKNALAVLLLLCVPASAGGPLALAGYVSAWTQDCRGSACALPVPGERNRPVSLALSLPAEPGQAAAAHVSETLELGPDGAITADISLYAICPYGAASGACPGRYFQAQVLLSGPAGAFCSASLNLQDFEPFPVLMCAAAAPGRRFGVTLHRKAL
ncbi:MAG: hypothetical protein NDI60_06560 [Elusimicrobiales bacterium]|nr:hypothetical protein [Elusimicrobiales bacterium]